MKTGAVKKSEELLHGCKEKKFIRNYWGCLLEKKEEATGERFCGWNGNGRKGPFEHWLREPRDWWWPWQVSRHQSQVLLGPLARDKDNNSLSCEQELSSSPWGNGNFSLNAWPWQKEFFWGSRHTIIEYCRIFVWCSLSKQLKFKVSKDEARQICCILEYTLGIYKF